MRTLTNLPTFQVGIFFGFAVGTEVPTHACTFDWYVDIFDIRAGKVLFQKFPYVIIISPYLAQIEGRGSRQNHPQRTSFVI